MKITTAVAVFGAFAWLAGSQAQAIDSVTGTYEGKLRCREIAGGVASKTQLDVTIEVVEAKAGVFLDIVADATPIASAVGGFLAEDAAKQDRAKLTGVECGLGFGGNSGAAVHADVVIKAASEKGTLKGTLLDMGEKAARAAICTFTAKRTSTTEPEISACN